MKKAMYKRYTARDWAFVITFVAIPIIHFLVFYVYVNIDGIAMAFQSKNAQGAEYFTLKNFADVFREFGRADSQIGEAVRNTLLTFAVSKCVAMPLALCIAFFMLKGMAGSTFFKVAFYLPGMFSAIANVYMFTYFVGSNGPLFELWARVGMPETKFPILFSQGNAMASILFYSVWSGMGFGVILYTASMNRIPLDLFESAKLDGAGFAAEFFNIVLPYMWRILSTEIIVSLAGCCNGAGIQLFTTRGKYGTYTVGYYMYEIIKFSPDPESQYFPAAFGLVLSIFLIPTVFAVRKLFSKFWQDAEV